MLFVFFKIRYNILEIYSIILYFYFFWVVGCYSFDFIFNYVFEYCFGGGNNKIIMKVFFVFYNCNFIFYNKGNVSIWILKYKIYICCYLIIVFWFEMNLKSFENIFNW